jgi:hypothetical protein
MAHHAAHKRDPITNESYTFLDGEATARRYFELAVTYWATFKEIHMLAIAALRELGVDFSRAQEFEEMERELTRFEQRLGQQLPLRELIVIWSRSREGLLRCAELFPERSEEILAQVAQHEDVLLALLERHERRQRAS